MGEASAAKTPVAPSQPQAAHGTARHMGEASDAKTPFAPSRHRVLHTIWEEAIDAKTPVAAPNQLIRAAQATAEHASGNKRGADGIYYVFSNCTIY